MNVHMFDSLTMAALATWGWEIMKQPPYSVDLLPSSFHSFGPLKEGLWGQKLDRSEELKCGVLNWLGSWSTFLYAASISALLQWLKKCTSVEGEYIEKAW
jgi:hypothetical protein